VKVMKEFKEMCETVHENRRPAAVFGNMFSYRVCMRDVRKLSLSPFSSGSTDADQA
jgi:hypothetical protein